MDYKSRQVYFNHEEMILSRKEFDLLWILSSNPGRVFTFEQLYQKFEADSCMETLNSVICRIKCLRKKLGDADCIESVRGVGYRFKSPLLV